MDVRRILAPATRASQRSAVARRYRIGARVLAAREPKLLRASTRLAAARMRVPLTAVAPAMIAAPPIVMSGSGVAPVVEAPAPAESVALARAAEQAPARDAPAPAITPESLGIGPASFEWLFGDPDKALAHPDVTAGPTASLPALSSGERSARRVARLTARGGSAYGRGARISEGPAPAPEPALEPEAQSAPELRTTPEPRVTPEPRTTPGPRVTSALPTTASEPAPPQPTRQRLVAARRPRTQSTRPLSRVIDGSAPGPHPVPPVGSVSGEAVTAARPTAAEPPKPPPPPSPGPPPVRSFARGPAARPEIVHRRPAARPARPAVQRAPRPVRAPARPSLLARAIAAVRPTPNFGDRVDAYATSAPKSEARVARPAMERALRPALRSAPRRPARLARATAAPRLTPNFGDAPDVYESPAPKSEARVARMALTPKEFGDSAIKSVAPAPKSESPLARATLGTRAEATPRLRASAERSSQPLTRAPAGPTPPTRAATPSDDPDAAYRELLSRVREEREQLGQLISHPF